LLKLDEDYEKELGHFKRYSYSRSYWKIVEGKTSQGVINNFREEELI
jgi:hypothetical protein